MKDMKEKDIILATVTHDMQNPLLAIKHTLKMVQTDVLHLMED